MEISNEDFDKKIELLDELVELFDTNKSLVDDFIKKEEDFNKIKKEYKNNITNNDNKIKDFLTKIKNNNKININEEEIKEISIRFNNIYRKKIISKTKLTNIFFDLFDISRKEIDNFFEIEVELKCEFCNENFIKICKTDIKDRKHNRFDDFNRWQLKNVDIGISKRIFNILCKDCYEILEKASEKIKKLSWEEDDKKEKDKKQKQQNEERIKLDYYRNLPYNEYLKTNHWKELSKKMRYKYGNKCQLCSSSENINTHHNNYSNIGNEKMEDLILLCNGCHKKFHNVIEKEINQEIYDFLLSYNDKMKIEDYTLRKFSTVDMSLEDFKICFWNIVEKTEGRPTRLLCDALNKGYLKSYLKNLD